MAAAPERRVSLPTGYRLLTDLGSLGTGGRRRKDNLVARGQGGPRVRHVPIVLEEMRGREGEARAPPLTPAPLLVGPGPAPAPAPRPQRFSLPSPSVTESAKVSNNWIESVTRLPRRNRQLALLPRDTKV
jgi:hypothetical protein